MEKAKIFKKGTKLSVTTYSETWPGTEIEEEIELDEDQTEEQLSKWFWEKAIEDQQPAFMYKVIE